MLIIVIYNIKDLKLRNRLKKILLNYGNEIQSFTFEFRLTNTQYTAMKSEIQRIEVLLSARDSIRIYRMCKFCSASSEMLGSAKLSQDLLYYIV